MRNHRPTPGIFSNSLLIGIFSAIVSFGYSQISNISAHTLNFPWAGGLNSCQFCAIDLNLDGINDLLVFDRHGNRKLTFLNHGTPDKVDYTNEPAYSLKLPELHDWVLTADYNCDGKMDLFTYGMGGVRVFQNISDTSLKFTLITDLLESFYYTGKVGILVTSVDYPALADIDSDGDPDLLTFFGLGSYVEYHKNLSMEKYGTCDSLDFKLSDHCWGKFRESEGGNKITLNAGCPYSDLRSPIYDLRFRETGSISRNPNSEFRNPNSRHTGSTMLATDLDHNGLKDLIVGDVDYPGLVALFNGGTRDSALMIAQDTAFPATSKPVKLFSFPALSLLDIDNDGNNDLLVSPFDPGLHTADNYNCVWFYKNTGTNALPQFEYQTDKLFRSDMMDFGSASHPVFFDFDNDGLQDLFVGNDGYYDSSYYKNAMMYSVYTAGIAYFKNTGTAAAPVFSYVTDDLAGISTQGIRGTFPAFGDMTGDGLPDLVTGNSEGTLTFYKNRGSSSNIPLFDQPVMNWQSIDVGDFSTPQLFDLDKDNIPELITGEKNGNLNLYKNTGTIDNPSFSLVTDSLGKVNVTNYNVSYDGFSTPCFSRLPDGTTFLVIGSEEGRIHLFGNIDHNLDGKFSESDTLFPWISATPGDTAFGWQTSPAIGHLSDPLAFDMITGNFSGGLYYTTKRTPAEIIPGAGEIIKYQPVTLKIYPNPADQTVTLRMPENSRPAIGRIDNLFGQNVLSFPSDRPLVVNVSKLPAGVYVVRIGEITAKLIITHP